jgi:hypothetical protein
MEVETSWRTTDQSLFPLLEICLAVNIRVAPMMRWAGIAAIVLAVAPAAYCSDTIRIAEIGAKGYYYQQLPARLRVVIFHSDPQPATVEIRVLIHSFPDPRIERVDTFSKRITLAPNDQRLEEMPVLLRFSPKATVQVQEVDARGGVLAEDTGPLEPPLQNEYLIAIVCAQPAVCQQAQSQISFSGTGPEQTGKGKVLRFVTMDDPPEQFWGYSPAQTAVLARPVAGMSANQREALEDYVREGQALIVLEDQAPDTSFLSAYRPPPSTRGVSSIGEGRIIWVPSLASSDLGKLYTGLALGRAILGWEGDRSVKDQLSWARKRLSVQFRFPTLAWLLAWLGAYVLIAGVGNFVLLRKLDRREWGWITLPCISLVFACAMYLSSASNRPHELRGDDTALYWMDEKSPVAFVERGERVSSNRRQQVLANINGHEILAGDRNYTGDSLSLSMFGDQPGDNPLSHWTVQVGSPTTVELGMLQWSYRDMEFVGVENEPGTVRRLDESHFRNETGKSFRQGMYVDGTNAYFFDSIPNGSQIDLAAARKKPFSKATHCRVCATIGFPSEIANVGAGELLSERAVENGSVSQDDRETITDALQVAQRPFDLGELIRAWPADGGHAFETRSGLFFGLADEAQPSLSFPGKRFIAKGYSITIVSYEPKP